MDLSSLIVTSLGVSLEVASTLYQYGKQVKGARREIQHLSNELFGLIGVLEHLKVQQDGNKIRDEPDAAGWPPPYSLTPGETGEADDVPKSTDSPQSKLVSDDQSLRRPESSLNTILGQTLEFLKELQTSLEPPKGRIRAKAQLLKWPMRDGEVEKHLARLERVKTFFVLSVVTDEADRSMEMANEIRSMRTTLEDLSTRQQADDSRKDHQALMHWLSDVDPNITRKSVEKARMPGTGLWFIESLQFQKQVKSAESSCLWLKGITGAGKTTLLTAAITELMVAHEDAYDFAYFYCSFSNFNSLRTEDVLGSILAQICVGSDAVYLDLVSRHKQAAAKSPMGAAKLDIDALVDLITLQATHRKSLYMVVDGINECVDPLGLLEAFETILKSSTGVRLLVSSIDEKKIRQSISRMPKYYEVTVSPELIESDVTRLVHSALKTHARLEGLPKALKSEIVEKLTNGVEDMFRWVQCQLDLLSKLRTPGAIQKALDSLPLTLNKTYEDLLGRIDGEEDRALAKEILQILAFSRRPLSLEEVSSMLQIKPRLRGFDKSKCLTHPSDILDICGSLLKYDEKTHWVSLAHHSVKTYLTSSPRNDAAFFHLDARDCHRLLALKCINYLSFDKFAGEVSQKLMYFDTQFEFDTVPPVRNRLPALGYAVYNWGLHMQEISHPDDLLMDELRYFLLSADSKRHNFQNWVHFILPHSMSSLQTPPLYYAASYGLTFVVASLLEMGVDIEVHGGRGGATPINIAAYRGHLDVVKMLYEHGADPLEPDIGSELNAVQWAAVERRKGVVDFFKSKGLTSSYDHLMQRANDVLFDGANKEATEAVKKGESDLTGMIRKLHSNWSTVEEINRGNVPPPKP